MATELDTIVSDTLFKSTTDNQGSGKTNVILNNGSFEYENYFEPAYGEMGVVNNSSSLTLTAGDVNVDTDYVKVDSGIWQSMVLKDVTFTVSN